MPLIAVVLQDVDGRLEKNNKLLPASDLRLKQEQGFVYHPVLRLGSFAGICSLKSHYPKALLGSVT